MKESIQQLESLFTEAVALPVEARAPFLDRTCVGDAGLRARIEALLQAHAAASGFLPEPSRARDPRATLDEPGSERRGT